MRSSTETLDADDKFHCDKCGFLQEAQVGGRVLRGLRVVVVMSAGLLLAWVPQAAQLWGRG